MSFVLHIFDEPSATTVEQATDYCYADHPPFPTPNNRYTQFLAEVTRIYPEGGLADAGSSERDAISP